MAIGDINKVARALEEAREEMHAIRDEMKQRNEVERAKVDALNNIADALYDLANKR